MLFPCTFAICSCNEGVEYFTPQSGKVTLQAYFCSRFRQMSIYNIYDSFNERLKCKFCYRVATKLATYRYIILFSVSFRSSLAGEMFGGHFRFWSVT